MTDALRFEVVRLRTIRSTYWAWLIGLGLSGLIAFGFVQELQGTTPSPAEATIILTGGGEALPFPVMGFAVAMIGILAPGHEYRYATILPTLTAMPRRSALLAAKALVVAAQSVAAAVVSIAVCWAIGSVTLGEALALSDDPVPEVLLGYVVLVALYGVLGVALGQLTRSIPAAIVIVLMAPLMIEPIIGALSGLSALAWLENVVPYLPFSAGMRLVNAGLAEAPVDGVVILERWAGGAVFAGFIALVMGVGWFLFVRRDA